MHACIEEKCCAYRLRGRRHASSGDGDASLGFQCGQRWRINKSNVRSAEKISLTKERLIILITCHDDKTKYLFFNPMQICFYIIKVFISIQNLFKF